MVALPKSFIVADLPPDEYDLIPAGTYVGMITESTSEITKTGDGAYILLKIELENGRVLFERLNVQNPNPKAEMIAYQTLGKICVALGVAELGNTDQLHNKRLKFEIDIEKGKPYTKDGAEVQGRDQNRIKKYIAYNSAQAEQVPVQNAAASSTPPWK